MQPLIEDTFYPSWEELFMRHAYLISSKSKDKRTKIGAVLVQDKHIISSGFNGLPMGTCDHVEERFFNPEKKFWFEHAERNAIYTCARYGVRALGATMFTNGLPCSDCTRALIQAGILHVVVHKQWTDYEREFDLEKWNQNRERTIKMFSEAKVTFSVFDKFLNIETKLDGNIIIV